MPRRGATWLIELCTVLLLLAGCSPMRLLGPGQRLLTKVQLEGVKAAEKEPLEALYRQRPNRRFPVPQLAIYNLGYTFYNPEHLREKIQETKRTYNERIAAARPDSVKVGKLLQKSERRTRRLREALDQGNVIMRIGNPPVVYDSSLTELTAQQIRIYLRSKGFFHSQVAARDTANDRRVTVTYRVAEGPQFQISQFDYDIADPEVARIIYSDTARALLKVGQPYDESVIGLERARLEALLKNRGYFDFRQQFITLEADTSFKPNTVRLLMLVANPADRPGHQVYTVRNVTFITDAGVSRFGVKRDTVQRNGVNYLAYNHRFSTRILDRKLAVRPGDRYSLQNSIITQRQLGELDVFRYEAVNYLKVVEADTVRGLLDAVVNTTPQKKYQETTELGGTYVAGLPGPFGNFRIRIRNAFGGAEVLDLGLRAGIEGQFKLTGTPDNTQRPPSVYTTQLGANVNLTLPQFLVPWRTNQLITAYSPRTRLTASYTYVNRPEYTRTNLEFTYDYIWQRNAYHQFIFTPFDISLVNTTDIDGVFEDRLRELPNGEALLRSFQRQLIPSANVTSLYNSNDFNQTRDARYLRLFAEVGGFGRRLYTREGDLGETQLGNVLVLDFARISADYRRYHKLTPHQFLVWRANMGMAQALSKTRINSDAGTTEGKVIPYDSYFFAGGGSSLRAWTARRVGIGSFTTTSTTTNGEIIRLENVEQPGELLLEGSVEYRFPLYDLLNGAVFTDFGNVWSLQPDRKRDGANFSPSRFYREFAVGSGLGFRFDFTFLIVRADLAAKVYDPAALPGKEWAIRDIGIFKLGGKNKPTLNIGIGYPF